MLFIPSRERVSRETSDHGDRLGSGSCLEIARDSSNRVVSDQLHYVHAATEFGIRYSNLPFKKPTKKSNVECPGINVCLPFHVKPRTSKFPSIGRDSPAIIVFELDVVV